MRIKTQDMTGPALDWAVAKCEGWSEVKLEKNFVLGTACDASDYSTDWSQGGPIIDREDIDVMRDIPCLGGKFVARLGEPVIRLESGVKDWCFRRAHTKLIAAMRCYVASKLGDEVDVPEELS